MQKQHLVGTLLMSQSCSQCIWFYEFLDKGRFSLLLHHLESGCGKGKREALVWAGTTPTEAIPNDRRTLIPWRRAGVVSGSCSCSSTGARLQPQVAGRRRPTATWARAADSAPPPPFHRSDWTRYPSGVQDGGRGRGSWPSKTAIGEEQAFGAERRPR